MTCRRFLIAFLVFFSSVCFGEVRIFISDLGRDVTLDVETSLGETIYDDKVNFPFDSSTVSSNQASSSYPHHYTFTNNNGQSSMWRIDEGQIPVFYYDGSITQHYTFFPVVSDGLVELSNPETGEVLYTTRTDRNGGFEIVTTALPETLPEFTLIDIKGGDIYWLSRPDDNILQALVRSDSFSRGSVTVSLPTTAAYLALQEHTQDVTQDNLYGIHEVNLNKVTRMLYQDVSQWSYETAYLNVEGGRLEGAHWFDNNDFMSDKVIDGDSSLFEVMAMGGEEQLRSIRDYFSELEGWGYIEPLLLDSFPVEIVFVGESVFDIQVIREKDGQLISDTIYSGVSDPNSIEIKYPTLMAEFGEKIKISPLLPQDSIINNWMGCNDTNSENCTYTIGRESHEIVGYIGVNPEYVSEVEAKYFNDKYYDYSESAFTGKAGVALSEFENLENYSLGERIVTSEKIYFYVEEIIIPENANSNEEFKLKVSLDHESNNLPGEYDMRYIDYWRMIFGPDVPYQANALIPLSWDDASQTGEALLTGPIMYSAATQFGVLTKPTEASSNEPFSLMSSQSSHCIEKSIPEANVPKQLKSISFNGTYKICVELQDGFGSGQGTFNRSKGYSQYSLPINLKGSLSITASGAISAELPSSPTLSPTVKADANIQAENLKIDSDGYGTIIFTQPFNEDRTPLLHMPKTLFSKEKYKLTVESALTSGDAKFGFYLDAGIKDLNASAGVSASVSGKELKRKVDPDGICVNFDTLYGIKVEGKLNGEASVKAFDYGYSYSYPFLDFYKNDFILDDSEHNFTPEEELCLIPELTITQLPERLLITDDGVEGNQSFYIENKSPLSAVVSAGTNNSLINLSSSEFTIPPFGSLTIDVIPDYEKIILLGNGENSYKTTFRALFSNNKGTHNKSFNTTLVASYRVDSKSQDYQLFFAENIVVEEYSDGIARIGSIIFHYEEYPETGTPKEIHQSNYQYDFERFVKLALKNQLLDNLKASYSGSDLEWLEGIDADDIQVDESKITIKMALYDIGANEYDIDYDKFQVIDLHRLGEDFSLDGFFKTESNHISYFHLAIIEYGREDLKVTNRYENWPKLDDIELDNALLSDPLVSNPNTIRFLEQRSPRKLIVNYIDKYAKVDITKSCTDEDGEVESYSLNIEQQVHDSNRSNTLYYPDGEVNGRDRMWIYPTCKYGDCSLLLSFEGQRFYADEKGDFNHEYTLWSDSCVLSGRARIESL